MTWIRLELDSEVHKRLKADAALAGMTLAAYLAKVLAEVAEKGQQ